MTTDRASVVTAAILQIVRRELTAWLDHDTADMVSARTAIEALLRDEFVNTAHTTLNEIRREDE